MYCTVQDVRLSGSPDSTDINDSIIYELIIKAQYRVNNDISTRLILEPIVYLDQYRQNLIDNSNTTFYVPTSNKYHMGDLNDDGTLTTTGDSGDIDVWVYDTTTNTRSKAVVSTLDTYGKFVLSVAPTQSQTLQVTYRFLGLPISPVHPLIKEATAKYASMLSHIYKNPDNFNMVKLGRLQFQKAEYTPKLLYKDYISIIREIDYLTAQRIAVPVNYITMDYENTGVI